MTWNTPPSLAHFCRDVLPRLRHATDGERVLATLRHVVATDRWNSFDRFHETTRTLVAAYEEAGARAEVYPVQTGGRIGSGRWIIHEATDVGGATLEVVHPVRTPVLDYGQNPWHVIQWSAATPTEGLRGRLVIVDTVEALHAVPDGELSGSFVLTSLDAREQWTALAQRGAAGVITDRPIADLPDATAWFKFGWGGVPLAHAAATLVGLVLSKREGEKLRALAAVHGDLTVEAKVDVRRYLGTHDVVSGLILGEADPQDEVWAMAHSAEPGALDNASGVAVCVEVARILESLIATGQLPRPRRTIRLLNAYECYGFFKFLEDVWRLQPPLAGVVIDTVGSRPEVCDGRLQWHSTLPMSAGFVDRVGETILRAALDQGSAGYQLHLEPFVETSDTLIGDPRYGFPAPWLTTHFREGGRASAAYHSSADTPDLASPDGLALCTAAMAGYLYYLANAGTAEVLELARAETNGTIEALGSPEIGSSHPDAWYLRERCRCSLDRLRRWLWEGERSEVMHALEECRAAIGTQVPRPRRAERGRRRSSSRSERIPHRKALLSPSGDNTPAPLLDRIRASGLPSWALFWADGNRSLAEIAAVLSCEHAREVPVEQVLTFFEAHAELGYVELIEPGDLITRSRLTADLAALGVERGMDLMVHSAMSRIGHVRGGADTVVDALLDVIGAQGTLLMPSFNHGAARVFNPMATPTTNGAIPDALWRRAEAVRSLHPTHAVSAIGPRAAAYCSCHLENGIWSQDSPIGRLVHGGGYILSLGVTQRSTTAYHVAENSMPCGCVDPFGKRARVVTLEGTVREVRGLAWRSEECPVPTSRLDVTLDERGLQRRGRVGNAESMLVRARDLWEVRREHLKDACPTCTIRPEADVAAP